MCDVCGTHSVPRVAPAAAIHMFLCCIVPFLLVSIRVPDNPYSSFLWFSFFPCSFARVLVPLILLLPPQEGIGGDESDFDFYNIWSCNLAYLFQPHAILLQSHPTEQASCLVLSLVKQT